ncbi:hypothetical protein ACFYVL_21465 [Streptomyces sp. NPDC004111]|uniref:hypothetical protein n=1 Tax=Streptomyces sp. NPDC004111 TaxID=3364690 RepID=UPI0036B4F04C
MASSESAPAGATSGTSGSPVPRAAELAVLAEEPTSGLFPEKAQPEKTEAEPEPKKAEPKKTAKAAKAAKAAAVPTASTAASTGSQTTAAEGKKKQEEEAAAPESEAAAKETAKAKATATASSTSTSSSSAPAKAQKEQTPQKPQQAQEKARETSTAVAGETPGKSKSPAQKSGSTTAAAATGTAVAGTTATVATASASTTGTKTATATKAATGSTARRSSGLALGRPGKPMIAAAVAGGLLLVGVPFLISGLSGSDDEIGPAAAQGPAGSRMGPDGSGPGIVPGQQNAPGENLPGAGAGGAKAGGSLAERSTGATGGLHEGGTTGDKGAVTKAGAGVGTGTVPAEAGTKPVPGDKTPPTAPGTTTGGNTADKPAEGTSGSTSGGTQKQQPATVATYNHLIGPGCDTAGFATSDQWRDSNKGWRGSKGSQTGYGCSGFYYSVPLSNSTSTSNGFAQWKFYTGEVTKGSCQVSVYIPKVSDISYVGGSPAYYTVHRAFVPKSSTVIGSFEINQTAHLGEWVNAGTFPATGKVSVVMDNRGKTSGNRHAAAAPIKVSCTA